MKYFLNYIFKIIDHEATGVGETGAYNFTYLINNFDLILILQICVPVCDFMESEKIGSFSNENYKNKSLCRLPSMSFVGNRSLQTAGRPPVLTLPTLPRLPTRPPALVTLVLFTLVVLPGPDWPARRPLLRPTRPELVVVLVWDHSTSFRRRSIKRTCK